MTPPKSEASRFKEIAEAIDEEFGGTEPSLLSQRIEQALQEAYQRGRESGIREAADIVVNAGREGKDWIKREILSLLSPPTPKGEE